MAKRKTTKPNAKPEAKPAEGEVLPPSAQGFQVSGIPRRKPGNPNLRPGVLPEALIPTMWVPGRSGNPAGFGGRYAEVLARCREVSLENIEFMIERMRDDDEDSRIRVVCAQSILDRAWGKPKEAKDDDGKAAPRFDFSKLTGPELRALAKIVGKASNDGEKPA